MADPALENAIARRDHLRTRLSSLAKEINELAAVWEKVRAETDEVERFIKMWYDMAGIQTPPELEQKSISDAEAGAKRIRPKNPDRADVAAACVNYIRDAGRPLSRAELLDQLTLDGIIIRGKDPAMVLSTMLWRSKDVITRLRGGGYWPAGVPLPDNYAGDLI